MAGAGGKTGDFDATMPAETSRRDLGQWERQSRCGGVVGVEVLMESSFMKPQAAHIAAVYLDKSRIGEVEMQVTMPEASVDQFIDSVGDKKFRVRSRFHGDLFV